MSDERSGCFGLYTLGYSSSGWGHWPLIDVGSLSANSYWPSAHPGSLGRLSGALNSLIGRAAVPPPPPSP